MMPKNVLITGANGKIGNAVCNVLEKSNEYNIIKFTHGDDMLRKNKNEYISYKYTKMYFFLRLNNLIFSICII